MTAVLEICDRKEYKFHIGYVGNIPHIYDEDAVYIVRNPTKLPRGNYRIVALIDEGKAATKEVVRFRIATAKDRKTYLK